MVKKSHSQEKIINKLREAEILLNKGATVGEASRKIGVTEQTYYRWRKGYGGMRLEQAKRLKDLEKDNARLKKLVAATIPISLHRNTYYLPNIKTELYAPMYEQHPGQFPPNLYDEYLPQGLDEAKQWALKHKRDDRPLNFTEPTRELP
jgi:hypothetical protein